MRVMARVFFHLLNWLRGPVLIVLFFGRAFFFLFIAVALLCLVAVPAQRQVELELLVLSLIGSLVCYFGRVGYDRALYRLDAGASR
jgi:hypothetical protein